MVTLEQLKQMHESEDHVEFKSARHNYPYNGGKHSNPSDRRHCLLGYIVALANERGGLLVLGMEDKFPHRVCGTDFAYNQVGDLTDSIYEALKIRVYAYELYEDTKRVLVLKVPSRPIGRLLKFEGVALMRIGESLREMSDNEMFAILSEQEPDFSAKICEGLTYDLLDENAIQILKERYAEKQNNPTFLTIPTKQILKDLELVDAIGKFKYAALILLGSKDAIRKFLPQNEIIIEYRLDEASIQYTARKEFQESLITGINKVWDYINQPASNPQQHINKGPYILDIPSYNEIVIREAILNAVAHRSMQIKSSVVIKQSPKSIRITNAGGFPIGVDKDNILTTISVPRSKLLCEVLQKTGLIERSGQGVDKIYYYCLLEGKALPDYSASDNYQVELLLKAKIENPAFHLFVKEEQEKRTDNNKLSVFHLLTLYRIKNNELNDLNKSIVQELLDDGLLVKTNEAIKLSDAYYKLENQVRDQVRDQARDQVEYADTTIKILSILDKCSCNRKALMEKLGYKNTSKFRNNYLLPLLEQGLITPTIFDKPTSPNQKYVITEQGVAFLKTKTK